MSVILAPGLPLAAAGKLELQIATAPLSARSTISGIEREKRNVALRNIEAIATAFNPSPGPFSLYLPYGLSCRSSSLLIRPSRGRFRPSGRVHPVGEGLTFGSDFR